MSGDKHLMRTIYRTDATEEEPDYYGAFSDTIPASAFRGGEKDIVHVDWSHRGWVEVTFLIPGPHEGHGNVPYEKVDPARSEEDIAKSVAALMFDTFEEKGWADNVTGDSSDLTDIAVDGTYNLLALARAIVTEVKGG